ncbi:MAG: serine--tRNA ligase [Verrucomicrobiia bacterium]
MLDIRVIREHPEQIKERLATRGASYPIDEVLSLDKERRAHDSELQKLNAERNRLSKEIGGRKKGGASTEDLEAQVKSFSARMAELNRLTAELDERQRNLLLSIPNLPHDECPLGADAASNPVVREWGEKPSFDFEPQDHVALAERLGLIDFERAAKISGSGFACFTGWGARLERALLNFLLDKQTGENGYREIAPPFLIRRDCMVGTGQLPKFEEDMYGLDDGALFLAPTAEVPVTNLYREELLSESDLPIKMAAYSPCFRREAGATGRDTRGILRVHQFDKVELVKIVSAATSEAEHEGLTRDAESILQALGLHYRVIELCTGDLGFSAAKTYDIEVWAPGRGAYLEVSSSSNFGDYQARRMGLRYKGEDGKNRICHTLNASGTALPRLYIALIETYQQRDGSVLLPPALAGAMGGEGNLHLKAERG